MIGIYCARTHGTRNDLCDTCRALQQYALKQTENCRFGNDKPVCSACPVHCYKRDMRQQIREVMRYAGPRMITRHPYYAIMHLFDKRRDEIFQDKFKTYPIK